MRTSPVSCLQPAWLGALLLLGSPAPSAAPQEDAQALLQQALAAEGLDLDREHGLLSVPATVLVRSDLLEYVLVGPRGATHESLFLTGITPSLLNAGLLALGAEPGENARWIEEGVSEPPERESEVRDAPTPRRYEVIPPHGPAASGLFLYAAWREGEETYLFRVEDLIVNLESGRSMRRHAWTFLGSRFAAPRPGEGEVFVADLEQNLINVSFFYQGNTLATASLPQCERQTIWTANTWLVPPRESPVRLILARAPLDRLPERWARDLPRVEAAPAADDSDGR